MSRDLPNKDFPGKSLFMRTRCCGWCKGDRQCLGRDKKKLLKKLLVKKMRRYINSDRQGE